MYFVFISLVIHVPYHGGFLPDMILLTQCYYNVTIILLYYGGSSSNIGLIQQLENPNKCHNEEFFFFLQPMIPPTTTKRFDIFSPDWGMLRRS